MILGETDFLPLGFVVPFMLLGLAMTALWVWSLVDALRIDDRRWDAAGQSKILWVLLIVLLGLLGSILYLVIPRPALLRARQA